ncbi:YwmB family TATA-box binding protein [Gracilibacillus alcaliphilus]|uniref:YwmB family TATA-box binding protein n=1 Tax=Gracilibacillus alcaliphilus TaxID=1401441 RepID=UPI00195E64EE|nr:YwmB family TATA-box binding protein [Gracilibacillus alcaliphilus]MBM7679738.1 hypothetical protein [Gracilibacillus alcaliphilus]
MKYLLIFCAIHMLFIFFNNGDHKVTANQREVKEMAATLEGYDLELTTLQTTIKETLEIDQINSFIEELKGYQMNMVENNNTIRFESADQQNPSNNETLLLVPVPGKQSVYQVIYTITMPLDKTEVLDTYNKRVLKVTKGLFSQNAQYFSCLDAQKDGIIDIVSFMNFVKDKLDITIIDEIDEANFYTWTGYSKRWNKKLQQGDDNINVHIAVSERIGDQTNITIGTPILINEY